MTRPDLCIPTALLLSLFLLAACDLPAEQSVSGGAGASSSRTASGSGGITVSGTARAGISIGR